MFALLNDRLLRFEGDATAEQIDQPEATLALACDEANATALLQSGQIVHWSAGKWVPGLKISVVEPTTHAAVSVCGRFAAVAFPADKTDIDAQPRILAYAESKLLSIFERDFFARVTDMHYGHGGSLGYGYLTSQPFDYIGGSYGNREWGVVISAADGTLIRHESEPREFDQQPYALCDWTADAATFAMLEDPRDWGELSVSFGGTLVPGEFAEWHLEWEGCEHRAAHLGKATHRPSVSQNGKHVVAIDSQQSVFYLCANEPDPQKVGEHAVWAKATDEALYWIDENDKMTRHPL